MSDSGPSGPLVCHLLNFFKINFFEKFFQKHHQSVKTVWIQIWLDILSDVNGDLDPNYKSYQQKALVDKELISRFDQVF